MPYGPTIKNIFPSAGVSLLLVVGLMDYLWGEYVFVCPCNTSLGQRRLYALAFLVIPSLILFVLEVRWRLCLSLPRSQWKVIIRTLVKPMALASLWVVFSFMEPKFVTCILEPSLPCCVKTASEDCFEEEKEGDARLRFWVTVALMFTATGLAALALCVAVAIIGRISCCKTSVRHFCAGLDCCCSCIDHSEVDQLKDGVELLRDDYKFQISTILKIYDEGLLPIVGRRETISSDSMTKLKSLLPCAEYDKLKAVNAMLGENGNQTEGECGQIINTDDKEQLVPSDNMARIPKYPTLPTGNSNPENTADTHV